MHQELLEDHLDNGRHEELGDLYTEFTEENVSSHTTLKQAMHAALETVSNFTSVQRADFVASFMPHGCVWKNSEFIHDSNLLDVRILEIHQM